MKGKTTTLKIKNLVLTMMLCCISSFANAQLVTGDIAFVGINSDANPNELAILTLSPIASGQTILITDYAWNGTSLEATNDLAEGAITWVTNTIVPKGTLIKITIGVDATIGGGLSAFGSVTATGWSGDAIASGGDNWFVLQGSIAAPNFIYAYANWSSASYGIKTWPSSGVTFPNATISYLPSSLSNGTTANIQSGSPLYHFDNNVYTGIKAGTKSDILAAIANSTSWSGSEVDTEIKDLSPGGTNFPGTNPIFTVGSPASVSTHPSSTSVCSNTNASFSIVASNATGYQWQVDQGQGAGFVNVSNTAPYSGATTATLTITNVTNAMNGYVYKCIAKGVADATSSSATLTVKQTTVVTDTQVACDTYTWINGVTYTANNNSATFTRTNAAGCNEVVTLNLTIKKSTAVTDTQVACDTYTWINGVTYTASNNTATFTRTNAAGCNEVVTLNLTINKTNPPTGTYSQGAILSGTLVDLVAIGNNIQWYDSPSGGMPLPLSTVLISGKKYYASQNNNSCESSTRLEVEVNATLKNPEFEKDTFSFYPNPVIDLFFLKSKEFIKVIMFYNSLGQEVLSKKVDGYEISIDLSGLPKGIFYASVISENKVKSIKILKK